MRQMHRLPEAPAVHRRVEDHEGCGQQGERPEHPERKVGDGLPPYAGDQCYAQQSLAEGDRRAGEVRGEAQEVQMQELEILIRQQSRTHRIHQLEQTRDEEGEADDDRANSSYDSHSIP